MENSSNPPWYMNISLPAKTEQQHSYPKSDFDPLSILHHEKIGQSDRLLDHTAKALLTRVSLEREQSRSRQYDVQRVRNHLIQFDDEPFGINQARDSMRWSLEQNLIALSREDRQGQLSFWQDVHNLSKDLLSNMESAESVKRRNALIEPYVLQSRIP